MKINLDKYYTPEDLTKYCVDKTIEVIGDENITQFLEPSAGSGVFLKFLNKPYLAYDIEPEGDNIIKQDFLKLKLSYKKGRCIIGNPPYGKCNTLSVKFYKKSILLGDYISFILPISQLNNSKQMNDFTLIYSEDLKPREYSSIIVHCCLNIYERNDRLIKIIDEYNLKDITINEYRRGNNTTANYDIRICGFGASIGKESSYDGQYVKEILIKINNIKLKNIIINLIKSADWKKIFNMTSSPNLTQWQIKKYIKENIQHLPEHIEFNKINTIF